MRGVRHWLLAASLCAAFAMAAVTDTEREGLCAYVAGRFDEAAVGLKQSIREQSQSGCETQAGESVPTVSAEWARTCSTAEHETSGIRREVTSPVTKGWMEEEMPFK